MLAAQLYSFGQTPTVLWEKSYGGTALDIAYGIVHAPGKGFTICGRAGSGGDITNNHGSSDFWLVNADPSGNILWQRSYGGSGFEIGRCIAVAPDSGFFAAGCSYSSDGDVTSNNGEMDGWVIRTDANGNLQWQIPLGGPGYEQFYGIAATSDGGCIVTGFTDSIGGDVTNFHGGTADVWVIKIDKDGIMEWQKTYGGTDAEVGYALLETADTNYLVAGYTISEDGDVAALHGGTDVWLLKLDDTGKIVWEKTYGGTGFEGADAIINVGDGFVVSGSSTSDDGDLTNNHGGYFGDCWVFKVNDTGQLQWQSTYGGFNNESARSVYRAKDGGYIIAGYTDSPNSPDGQVTGLHGLKDYWVLKIDSVGNLIWQKTLGGSADDEAYGILQMSDSTYIVAGYTNSTDGDITSNHGFGDCWIVNITDHPVNGTGDLQIESITVYPTITNGVVYINTPSPIKDIETVVYDCFGKKQAHALYDNKHVDLHDLPPGLYFLKLSHKNGSKVFKILRD